VNLSSDLERKSKERILNTWKWLCEFKIVPAAISNVDGYQFFIDPIQLAETVEQYASDCDVLKIRYAQEENDKIQPPKIAGLMASSINRHRPIVIREGFSKAKRPPLNELLAIFNGLFVCSEFSDKNKNPSLTTFYENEFFSKWLNDFLHILCYRNYTAENLIMLYETLCISYCRDALTYP